MTKSLAQILELIKQPGLEIFVWVRSGQNAHTSLQITPSQATTWAQQVAGDSGNGHYGQVPCFLSEHSLFLGQAPTP